MHKARTGALAILSLRERRYRDHECALSQKPFPCSKVFCSFFSKKRVLLARTTYACAYTRANVHNSLYIITHASANGNIILRFFPLFAYFQHFLQIPAIIFYNSNKASRTSPHMHMQRNTPFSTFFDKQPHAPHKPRHPSPRTSETSQRSKKAEGSVA